MFTYTRICLIIGFYFLIPSEANCGNTFSGNKPSTSSTMNDNSYIKIGEPLIQHFHAEFRMYAPKIQRHEIGNHSTPQPSVQSADCNQHHQGDQQPPQLQPQPPPPQPLPSSGSCNEATNLNCPPPCADQKSEEQGHEYDPNCYQCREEAKEMMGQQEWEMRQQQQQQQQQQYNQPQYAQGPVQAPPPPQRQQPMDQPRPCPNCDCYKQQYGMQGQQPPQYTSPDPITRFVTGPIHDVVRRVNNIILYGAQIPTDIDVVTFVLDLINTHMRENVTRDEIDYIKVFYPRRRVMYYPNRAPPICVRFRDYERKKQLLSKRYMLDNTPFQISNDLTPRQVIERKVLSRVCEAMKALAGYEDSFIHDDKFLMVKGRPYAPMELGPLLASLGLPEFLLNDLLSD